MNREEYLEAFWSKIINGEFPHFDIALEIIEILKEEAQRERYSNYDGTIYRSITSKELRRRLEASGIEVTPQFLGKTVHTFLTKKKLNYEPKVGPITKYSRIAYSHEKLKELEKWAQSIVE